MAATPRYRALLIGNAVFRRDPQGLPRLQGPRADVDALHDALADPDSGMFTAENIDPLIDRGVQNLREELHRFFIEEATRDDVLFLYYSGHGKLDLLGRLHLCASDTRVNALPVTALRYKEDIEALIEASPAPSTVTILDCCHSGAFRGGDLKVKATGSGRCVITSASASELALDALGPNGMSPFTNALVTGLRFAQPTGQLTAQALYDYVETELSPAGTSSPQFFFDGEGAIVLARRQPVAVATVASAATAVTAAKVGGDLYSIPAELGAEPIPNRHPEPDAATQEPQLALPEPRTRLWSLLNEAATSTRSGQNNIEEAKVFRGVVDASVCLDPKWARAIVRRADHGFAHEMAVEGLAAGLARIDAELATNFIRSLSQRPADQLTACLAAVVALPESAHEHTEFVMREAIKSFTSMPSGVREARLQVGLLEIFARAKNTDTIASAQSPDVGLLRAASAVIADRSDIDRRLVEDLRFCVRNQEDPNTQASMRAEIALRVALFDPGTAHQFLTEHGRFPSRQAFSSISGSVIAAGAAAMIETDPQTAHRLFEIAEHGCQSEADWADLFEALLGIIESPPAGTSVQADHLIEVIERVVDQVPQRPLQRLSSVAVALAASAPKVAEDLLRLDPDERRGRQCLISAAKAATRTDPAAAKRMAMSVERMLGSVESETEQAADLIRLIAILAPIDFDHALRLFHSLPPGSWKATAARKSAAALALHSPDRLDEGLRTLETEPNPEFLIACAAEGLASVDPRAAVRLAASMPAGFSKGAILLKAVHTMIPKSLEEAEEIADCIEEPRSHRASALSAIAQAVAPDDPEHAASIANAIPEDDDSLSHKTVAFVAAATTAAERLSHKAEQYLAEAERAAHAIDAENSQKCIALAVVAAAVIKTAPMRASQLLDEAERLALAIPEEDTDERGPILAELMVVWASVAPRRAERLIEQIPTAVLQWDEYLKRAVLEMVKVDSRRAEQLASTIEDNAFRLEVQSDLVAVLSASSPARAERLALSMPPGEHRAHALLTVAEALHRRRSGD